MIITTDASTVKTFRRPLIAYLNSIGIEPLVISYGLPAKEAIEGLKGVFVSAASNNRSTSVFESLGYKRFLKAQMKEFRPDIVLTFQAKPNIFGTLTAKKVSKNAKSIMMVEGQGDPFTKKGLKWSFIRMIVTHLYKKTMRKADAVFFLNKDNRDFFVSNGICPKEKAHSQQGVGIDLGRFQPSKISDYSNVLFCGRLLKTKGVGEFIEAASIVKKSHPEAKFVIAGRSFDFPMGAIDDAQREGTIEYIAFRRTPPRSTGPPPCWFCPHTRKGFRLLSWRRCRQEGPSWRSTSPDAAKRWKTGSRDSSSHSRTWMPSRRG